MSLAPDLASSLLFWYDENGRSLPWRKRRGQADPYPVLVSEIMLQQTTVPAVIPYFEKWMKKYPTARDLAGADPDQVLRNWEGLGYYSRARNLQATAREVVHRYDGAIPADPEKLKGLPGIGDYTAAAVGSIAFGTRVPALDANNLRVWSRLLASSDRKRIIRVFSRVIPPDRPGDFNQALMDLGSAVCTPKNSECSGCPLSKWCRAFHLGRTEAFPERKPGPEITPIEAAVGILIENGMVLVQKRPEGALLGGLWEFPGGKIGNTVRAFGSTGVREKKDNCTKTGPVPGTLCEHSQQPVDATHTFYTQTPSPELPEQAVIREVLEETGLKTRVVVKLGVFTHSYTRFRVRLHVFICQKTGGKVNRPDAKWVTLPELEELPMPSANRRIVEALEKWPGAVGMSESDL